MGRIDLGHRGPRRPDIPDPNYGLSRTETLELGHGKVKILEADDLLGACCGKAMTT